MFKTEILIKGKLNPNWSDWFDGMCVQVNLSGDTVLYGDLADNSAVYGVLSRLGSLGITLISVSCRAESPTGSAVEAGSPDAKPLFPLESET